MGGGGQKGDPASVHVFTSQVISQMKKVMAEEPSNPFGSSFLLDDDSSIPFIVEDLLRSMPDFDLADIETPLFLREILQPMPA